MKFNDLQKKSPEDLKKELGTKQAELLRFKAQIGTGAAGKDSGKVRDIKRTIARIHTILNSKIEKKTEGKRSR
jgi:large subunit ribosomal protein L29